MKVADGTATGAARPPQAPGHRLGLSTYKKLILALWYMWSVVSAYRKITLFLTFKVNSARSYKIR